MKKIEELTEKDLLEMLPHELTQVLYKGFLKKMDIAIEATKEKDFGVANENLKKCNDIVERLGAGIKYDAGLIADQLDNLYNYIAEELIQANLKKDIEKMENIRKVMTIISDGWDEAVEKGFNDNSLDVKLARNINAYEKNF